MGIPKPEPGPVKAKLTPMLMSAKAAEHATVAARVTRVFLKFMVVS
jgi:hypothetical protein